jgi:hypothetical protein
MLSLTHPPSRRYIPAMPETETPPARPPAKRGFFTAENAAKYAELAHAARRQQSIADATIANALPLADSADNFVSRKLARVRGQIDVIEKLLDKATEPQAVDRFCNALTRLYDVERILAGRPLPGSRRPREDRGRVSAGWIELQPELPGQLAATAPVAPVAQTHPARPMGWEYETPADPPPPAEPDKLPGDVTP